MNRFKTYAFWVALSSAIVILIQNLGKLFGFEIESGIIENVIMSICRILVVLGIVSKGGSDIDNSEEKGLNNSDVVINQNSEPVNNKQDVVNDIDESFAPNKNKDDF